MNPIPPGRIPDYLWRDKEFRIWYLERPESIQRLVANYPPNSQYTIQETGMDYYVPFSYQDDGTLTVVRFNAITDKPMWKVCGIEPRDLLPLRGM